MSQQVLLSPKQVSERLGVAENTLADWRWKRIGPPFTKIGKFAKYIEEHFERWVEQQEKNPIER